LHAAIPVYIDAEHAIAHNKIMVIDGQTVITGSFNFTNAAEEHIRLPAVDETKGSSGFVCKTREI
jgi:hypothetical protein